MLRVGLTGGMGSGKSAVALVWAHAGVPVLAADAIGRALMEPGEPVYEAIVAAFGSRVVAADGALDRAALAREAFAGGRLAELNTLVHPAVIAAQEQKLATLAAEGRHALAVVESALIFEASGSGEASGSREASSSREASGSETAQPPTAPGWRERFGRLVLVTAPEDLRIERFVDRVTGPGASPEEKDRLRQDARRRLASQLPDDWKRAHSDYVIENTRTLVLLRRQALRVLAKLRKDAALDEPARPRP